MIEKKYSIGFTHAKLSEEQQKLAKEKGGEVVHIPVVLCGVVPIYNVKELADKPPLKFNADVLAKIFLGEIDHWSHKDLQDINKGVRLPKTKITVVHREDSSGTTLIFADYLYGASDLWKTKIGKPKSLIQWPVGVGMARNNGVATKVPEIDGAIGYVDLLFAKARHIPYGSVENEKKVFIHAEPENLTAAAQEKLAGIPDDLTFSLTNTAGKDAYPISGAVWAVCYQNQPTASRQMVVDFLNWINQEGQQFAKDRMYAPLPEGLTQRAEQKIKSITAAP